MWQFRRKPLSQVPLEVQAARDVDEARRMRREQKAASNSSIEPRLHELGLLPETNNTQ
jgi:hypothetical protein